MDTGTSSGGFSIPMIILGVLVAIAVALGLYLGLTRASAPAIQGFYGGAAAGTGRITCEHTSKEAAELAALFTGRNSSTEEGEPDLREFRILLGKLACFKKDLLSPSGIVVATRGLDYRTSHDLEPIQETTARCNAKTIPPRDLELAFTKWSQRGSELLRRLCASYDLSGEQISRAENVFRALISDVADIARGACLKGKAEMAGMAAGPRDARPQVPADVDELGPYDGYY